MLEKIKLLMEKGFSEQDALAFCYEIAEAGFDAGRESEQLSIQPNIDEGIIGQDGPYFGDWWVEQIKKDNIKIIEIPSVEEEIISTIKFSVAHYTGIAENPIVILLDRKVNAFKRQFNNVEELKKCIGDDAVIYFVADADDKRINNLHNWRTNANFDFNALEKFVI